jgi:DNA invertase Pin-like site-specific DNA recombinase
MSFRRITTDRGSEMKIGYARVSTQEQDLALQLDALVREGCETVFQEKASGAQRERPELKAAVAYMRKGDTLVVWKIDRLARSMKQLIEMIESFQERGIGLKSLHDPIDTSSPSGKLVFHIFAALAEFERGVIRERTTAGLRAARERGRVGGRPPALAAVARRLNVAASTLYRHIPGARSASLEAHEDLLATES